MTDEPEIAAPEDEWSEFQRAAGRVWRVLMEHVPDVEPWDNRCDTYAILAATRERETPIAPWNPDREVAKIDKIRCLAAELSEAWRTLHPRVAQAMLDRVDLFGDDDDLCAHVILNNVEALDEVLHESLTVGMEAASSGHRARADRNWKAVGVIHECRAIWHRRTGKAPPKSLNRATPFGRFLADVLEAIGIEADPRAALNAWRRYDAGS